MAGRWSAAAPIAARSAAEEDAEERARLVAALCGACVAKATRRGDRYGWHPACAAAFDRARVEGTAAHVGGGGCAAA